MSGTALPTDRRYDFQRDETSVGLVDMKARLYSSLLGRFISADTIVPRSGDPQALNRFAYTRNSPLKYIDPTGHDPHWCDSASNSSLCYDEYMSSHTQQKLNARIYFLNPIGWGNKGQIKPSKDSRDLDGYTFYRLQLLAGAGKVKHIPVYTGDQDTTREEMFDEMGVNPFTGIQRPRNHKYSAMVAATIARDLTDNPLGKGEKLILVGDSGGGTVAIEALDFLADAGISVDQVILRGSPVNHDPLNNVGRVDYITSCCDYYHSSDSNPYDGVDVQEHVVGGFWFHVPWAWDDTTRRTISNLIVSYTGQ